jgi:hypothetical protein
MPNMPKTYFENNDRKGPIEPVTSRARKSYRGSRSSAEENLEINSIIVDLNRMNLNLDRMQTSIDNVSKNLVSNISNLSSEEILNNGTDYEVEDVGYFIDDRVSAYGSNEQDMVLSTINKMSGTIKKLQSKISRLEKGKEND